MSLLKIREKLYRIIFHTDTPEGKIFDVVLLIIIALNVLAVMIDSVPSYHSSIGKILLVFEWVVTIIFSIEYIFRVLTAPKASKYIFSFYGIIDLLSILPTFLGLIIVGTHSLAIIRALRLLRLFRVLKLSRYANQGAIIIHALRQSWAKISVFLFGVITIVLIIGTVMYLVEGPENGFTSIPRGVYWSIVTVTTVGYGDITPSTALGQIIASFTMILGYAIIAVPTGIITVEISRLKGDCRTCTRCKTKSNNSKDNYCSNCGETLPEG